MPYKILELLKPLNTMAQTTFIVPVETIRGKLHDRDRTVLRRKRARDSKGHVIAEMAQEAYIIRNPRNWKKTPAVGAEKQNMDNWKQACQRAKIELADDALRQKWQQRWEAQLKHPEKEAPLDPNTNRPKVYIRFDCFVRAVIFRELKSATSSSHSELSSSSELL